MSHLVSCPKGLEDLLRSFVAEVSTSVIRHQVRGKLSSVRNGAFYVRRKLEGAPELTQRDPRLLTFLEMIDAEMAALGDGIVSRLPPPEKAGLAKANPAEVAHRLVRTTDVPSAISVQIPEAGGDPIRVDPAELELALFCLLENAIEAVAGGGDVGIRVRGPSDGRVSIEVSDSGPGMAGATLDSLLAPFYSTKPGRMGVGLKIAQRIAGRWGGKLSLGPLEGSAAVTISFPVVPS